MILKEKPENIDFEVVSCFCQKNGKHLILKRTLDVYMPGKWGPPGGKVHDGESLNAAICREILEETGITISMGNLEYFGKYYISHLGKTFTYHVFSTEVEAENVILNPKEHQSFRWVTPLEALKYPLIHDQGFVIKEYFDKKA